jgi:hypothetical protein
LFLSHVISEMENKIFMNSNKPHQWCKYHRVIDPVFEPDEAKPKTTKLVFAAYQPAKHTSFRSKSKY